MQLNMKKTLKNIIFGTGLVIGGLGLASGLTGCAGMGYTMMQDQDPRVRAIGNIMYHEGIHEERMEEAREGRSEVNVGVGREEKRSQYQTGDIFNDKAGHKWVRTENGQWIYPFPDGESYALNDSQIEDISRTNGIPIDTSNRKSYDNTKIIRAINEKLRPTLFICNKIIDINKNDTYEDNEFFGFGKKSFNLNEEKMTVYIYAPDYEGDIVFRSWTNTGKLIG